MKRPFIELTYYDTYWFSNIIKDILESQLAFIQQLDEFLGENRCIEYSRPFRRYSAFHEFVCFVLDDVFSDEISGLKLDIRQDTACRWTPEMALMEPHPARLPTDLALEQFGINHQTFEEWLAATGKSFDEARDDDVWEYYDSLRQLGAMEKLLARATSEVFFVLFQNRHVLLLFNEMVSGQLKQVSEDDLHGWEFATDFARPGVLRRVAVPAWVQRAVYYRDRGICVMCSNDLSGILSVGSEENYDHIVPLAEGGLNDVSNIQLLCRECNARKQSGRAMTSARYEAWYPEFE